MKILLFGGTGCFGTAFANVCYGRAVTLVSPSHGEVDITDPAHVRACIGNHSPDAVINSVAVPGINPCEEDPAMAYALHTVAPYRLLLECTRNDVHYVQTSTHAVFDGNKRTPYTEEDRPSPVNIYGSSKLAAEELTAALCPRHYIVRFPTLFGDRRNEAFGFADKAVGWLREGREPQIAADKIDSPTYARDAASRLLEMLLSQAESGLYHLANTGADSFHTFVCSLRDLLGLDNVVHEAKDADFPGIGIKPLRTALVTVRQPPLRSWREALEEYVERSLIRNR